MEYYIDIEDSIFLTDVIGNCLDLVREKKKQPGLQVI